MLIDTKLTIAYKCASCGTYEYFDISLFELSGKKKLDLHCRCKKSSICISEGSHRNIELNILCMSCTEEHTFLLKRKEVICKKNIDFFCTKTGMPQIFSGSDKEVREKIDSLERELDELINFFGYDNYFSNTQVMFDTLNKIHDVAQQGNLICECGNVEIQVHLLSDRIYLKCNECLATKCIPAKSNEDLKNILKKDHIVLLKNECIDNPENNHHIRKK